MPPSPLRLKNVLKQQSAINLLLFNAALGNTIPVSVRSLLCRTTEQIESICTKNQVTPAALAAPSRAAYAWMGVFVQTLTYKYTHITANLPAIRQEIWWN